MFSASQTRLAPWKLAGTRKRSRFSWLLFALLTGVLSPPVNCQPGFLNIDCGSDEDYYDSLGRYWESDAKYISTGTSLKNVPLDPEWLHYGAAYGHDKQIASLRFFDDPKHNRDCYTLPTKAGTTYIVASLFCYSNFLHNYTTSVSFSVYLNGSMWIPDNVMSYGEPSFRIQNETYGWDAVVHSNGSILNVCLVRKSGPSFISALQLRELASSDSQYSMAKERLLKTHFRIACRNDTDIIRYPDDMYDRLWWSSNYDYNSYYGNTTGNLAYISNSTSLGHFDSRLAPDAPLPGILQHAIVDENSQGITFSQQFIPYGPPEGDMYVTAYFLEVNRDASDTSVRGIDYTINGQYVGTINTTSTPGQVVGISAARTVQENYLNVTFKQAQWSKLPAILNAMEIFVINDYSTLRTADKDLAAIDALSQNLNLSGWTGDPCVPSPFLWINCTADSLDPTILRITSLMLSNMGISGSIPTGVLQLEKLVNLSLTNNNFTGSIPDLNSLRDLQFLSLDSNRLAGPIPNLSDLVHLQSLTLQHNFLSGTIPKYFAGFPNFTDFQVDYNNFSGTVPSELIAKQNSGLRFTYTNNQYLHRATSSSFSSKIGLVVGITAAIVASLLICGLIARHFITRKQRARRRILKEMGINNQLSGVLSNSKKQKDRGLDRQSSRPGQVVMLSLEDVYKATRKFSRKIGQGSFGPVYYGTLPDGKEVAVKVNSGITQGLGEFLNEVDLLSRVHHRNLVSLVGYCEEAQQEILIYTYLPNGSLCDHLYGNRSQQLLDWKRRLNIALNAATGLEYLHVSCNPRIIHRDVKSSNILLDESWVAKVADFGISRQLETIAGEAGSCITGVETRLKGTPGYIDPNYMDSHKLTPKSDVYSFGVVLLEILSGHHPHVEVLPDGTARTLVQRAHASVQAKNPLEIFDPALRGEFSYDAAIGILDLAIRCTSRDTAERPNMREVVHDITEAIKMDNSCESVVGEDAVPTPLRQTYGQVRHSGEELSTDMEDCSKRVTKPPMELENNSKRITETLTEMENNSDCIPPENGILNPPHAAVVNFNRRDSRSMSSNRDSLGDRSSELRSPLGTAVESYFEIEPR